MPNIVVTPSDSPSVHRILYFPPTKEHFKLKLNRKFIFKLAFVQNWGEENLFVENFFLADALVNKRSELQHFDQKLFLKRCSFGSRSLQYQILDGNSFGPKTNSANFLIWRKSETQLLTNFYNALVNSIPNLYRLMISYSPFFVSSIWILLKMSFTALWRDLIILKFIWMVYLHLDVW